MILREVLMGRIGMGGGGECGDSGDPVRQVKVALS